MKPLSLSSANLVLSLNSKSTACLRRAEPARARKLAPPAASRGSKRRLAKYFQIRSRDPLAKSFPNALVFHMFGGPARSRFATGSTYESVILGTDCNSGVAVHALAPE